jgi:2',3'-cyclic-nucleotide 2'-phosphodiesterase (5'-nucleotidase family)
MRLEPSTVRQFTRLLRRRSHLCILALCLVLIPASAGYAAQRLELTLLHTNDIHGHMLPFDYGDEEDVGGAARRATLIDRIRRETRNPLLVVDAGDVVTRGPLWTEFRGTLDIDVMNTIGYDLAVVGNNEFKVGMDTSAQGILIDLVKRSRFPWICANAFDGSGAYLSGVKPYLVREINGVRVAFLGLTAPRSAGYPQCVGWKITDPIQAARAILPQIRREADIVIALTHIGYALDLQLAGAAPDLDAIVGGDSHTFLPEMTLVQRPRDPAKPAAASRRMPIPIVQDGEFGRELGRLDLRFERADSGAWELRECKWRVLPITRQLSERSDVAALIRKHAAPLRQPLGSVEVPGRTAAERELPIRRLIARALKEEMGADVGLLPPDTLYGTWKSGPISRYDIRYVLPFPDRAAVVTVQGKDLRQVITLTGMAIAGAEVRTAGNGREPDVRVGAQSLDPEATYRVAVMDFHAREMPGLKGAPAQIGDDLREVIARWVQRSTARAWLRSAAGLSTGRKAAARPRQFRTQSRVAAPRFQVK